MIHVNASKLKGRTGSLRLFDMEGGWFEKKVEVIAGGYVTSEINMQGIAKRMYIVTLLTEKSIFRVKLLNE
ncbi:MAG: hypothetical protein IPJ86_06285 [Bacteroidetes bacterium]|nr:hypothetical protein [Bacteroidota bacterium]